MSPPCPQRHDLPAKEGLVWQGSCIDPDQWPQRLGKMGEDQLRVFRNGAKSLLSCVSLPSFFALPQKLLGYLFYFAVSSIAYLPDINSVMR